ncbi:MAG: hypothetical protein R3A46_06915 [Thermomicrobiales bacterium]
MTAQATRPTTLQEQARELKTAYPELYAHLNRREANLRRALGRIPSPADIELSAAWNHQRYVDKTMRDLGAGLDELAAG